MQSSNEDLPAFHKNTNEYHKKLEKPHKKQIKTQIGNQKMIQNLASTSIFPTNFLGNQTANQERERYEAGAGTIARVWVKKKKFKRSKDQTGGERQRDWASDA